MQKAIDFVFTQIETVALRFAFTIIYIITISTKEPNEKNNMCSGPNPSATARLKSCNKIGHHHGAAARRFKSVTLSNTVTVREGLHRNNYTYRERKDTWFSRLELEVIRERARADTAFSHDIQQRRNTQKQAIAAVLSEQLSSSSVEPHRLREVYQTHTEVALVRALTEGKQNAMDALRILCKDNPSVEKTTPTPQCSDTTTPRWHVSKFTP